jgi:hypothetical protein
MSSGIVWFGELREQRLLFLCTHWSEFYLQFLSVLDNQGRRVGSRYPCALWWVLESGRSLEPEVLSDNLNVARAVR